MDLENVCQCLPLVSCVVAQLAIGIPGKTPCAQLAEGRRLRTHMPALLV